MYGESCIEDTHPKFESALETSIGSAKIGVAERAKMDRWMTRMCSDFSETSSLERMVVNRPSFLYSCRCYRYASLVIGDLFSLQHRCPIWHRVQQGCLLYMKRLRVVEVTDLWYRDVAIPDTDN